LSVNGTAPSPRGYRWQSAVRESLTIGETTPRGRRATDELYRLFGS